MSDAITIAPRTIRSAPIEAPLLPRRRGLIYLAMQQKALGITQGVGQHFRYACFRPGKRKLREDCGHSVLVYCVSMTPSKAIFCLAPLAATSCATVTRPLVPASPQVDYHQHLVSPEFSQIAKVPELDATALVRKLDEAGVARAVVLSTSYSMADERKRLTNPDGRTREENDWTSAQVASTNGRLIGFCGVNPLRDQALSEIRRCLTLPGMRGVKLHFGNSGVSLRNDVHRARMVELFSLIGKAKAPVLVHMRARGGENFGSADAQLFIDTLLPLVRGSDVIVAHFGGAGPGYPEQADEVMAVFAFAAERGDPRLRGTYFDLATVLTRDSTAAEAQLIARRVRQLGPKRVLYGSDLLTPTAPSISEAWGYVTSKLGLTQSELSTIAANRLSFVP